MNTLANVKGLVLITIVILAVLYFSPDLECMLLFSGILVNIITICLNTGALKLAEVKKDGFSSVPESWSSKATSHTTPRFVDLVEDKTLLEDIDEEPTGKAEHVRKEGMNATMLKYKGFEEVPKYKGAVDIQDASEPIQIGADRIALVGNARQGINARKSLAGPYTTRRVLYPAISRELDIAEGMRWWSAFDDTTTIEPKAAPY